MAGTAVSPPTRRSARSRTATNGRSSSSRATRSSKDEDDQESHEMDQEGEPEQSEPVTPTSEHASAEITRCICGQQELEVDSDESAGLYIQCDRCQVWQHGYCVGIYDAGDVPDDYCCELCRPDLHSITVNSNGRKHSSYLPLTEPGYQSEHDETTRSSSRSRSSLKTTGKDSQSASNSASSTNASHKRRSTMNSRDSAYEEILQRVLEESAHDDVNTKPDSSSTDSTSRSRKRASAPQSEEVDPKRIRVSTPPLHNQESPPDDDNKLVRGRHTSLPVDESGYGKRSGSRSTRSNGNGSSFHDSKRVKSERFANDERQSMSEPTDTPDRSLHLDINVGNSSLDNKRNDPTETSIEDNVKKDDDNDDGAPAAQGGKPEKSKINNGSSTPSGSGGGNRSRRPRRGGGAGNRGNRGNNRSGQASPMPGTPTSKDSGWLHEDLEEDSYPPSKPRIPQARTSLGEMRKRVAAILEFIGRTQIDLSMEYEERKILLSSCGDPIPFDFLSGFHSYTEPELHDDDNNNSTNDLPPKSKDQSTSELKANDNNTSESGTKNDEQTTTVTIEEEEQNKTSKPESDKSDKGKDKICASYKNLLFEHQNPSLQLLENLTRKLLAWEQMYGRYGDS